MTSATDDLASPTENMHPAYMAIPAQPPRTPAYYSAPISAFLRANIDEILGRLASQNQFALEGDQRDAWQEEIRVLQSALRGLDGTIYLEFDVPRLGSRIDAVVVAGPGVFPIEFKCGASEYRRADYNQAWDYALDLKNFHRPSHDIAVFPILVATAADTSDAAWSPPHNDGVRPPMRCNAGDLRRALDQALAMVGGDAIDGAKWEIGAYEPSPTIIEAAQALYSRHSVEAISRSDAGARNLRVTSRSVEEVIDRARATGEKAIVFVTGVPGSGKTLVGLNVATKHRRTDEPTHAVFLSGNGPLVAVLQEALTRDEVVRKQSRGEDARVGAIRQQVKPFIQNVHHFRDDGVRNRTEPPADHVVVFDEAQRAWNVEKTSDFMRRRKKVSGFAQSESEFLISYMNRHQDWAVIVCLVGGGQEIHTGEAGIAAWLDAVREHFPDWRVFISPDLTDSEYAAGHAIEALGKHREVVRDEAFHLSVSMRSFRSEKVSAFVKAVLDLDKSTASKTLQQFSRHYPIALTRDLAKAKRWIRDHARGSERYGLVASSQAYRLKPHAVDVRVDIDPVHWFLNDEHDTRSSYYLEDAATEFQIQGLELDWVCMTWDADLRMGDDQWRFHAFKGRKWERMHAPQRQQYLLNAYRVLLTRARQGMVIFVPQGDPADPTRDAGFYDETFAYLAATGISSLQ